MPHPASQPAGSSASPPQRVLTFMEARRRVEEVAAKITPVETEPLELLLCPRRVLAEEVKADRDFPPFPRAARDGYALRAEDLAMLPARLRVVGEVKAGQSFAGGGLNPGEAVEIMTGAPAPHSADAVVMVEYTQRAGDSVEIQRGVRAGDNIVPAGSEAQRGAVLLEAGSRLTPAAMALLASVGRSSARVFQRPRVAILATGDELVEVEAAPGPCQIRNSNSYSLAAQVEAAGGQPVLLPIAPDEPQTLRRLVEQGLAADLLLLSGGVSMGKYDLVEQALEALGSEFFFTGAQIQPGKPVVFGRAPGRAGAPSTCFFGLPGNPVSTLVTFELFARVILEALAGMGRRKLVFPQVKLKHEIKTKTGLTRFLPGKLHGELENSQVELVRWQGSGDLASTAQANCFVVVPPDRERIAAGEMVSLLISQF